MKELSIRDCLSLAHGGTIYGTGGGLPCEIQIKIYSELFTQGVIPKLCTIDDLVPDAMICCVHGIGPAGSFSEDFSRAVFKGIQLLEAECGCVFKAVFPVETSIESAVFAALSMTRLPLLDADVTGGRAVPEISMDNFFIARQRVTPAVMVNLDLESMLIVEDCEPQDLEIIARDFAKQSRENLIALIDHPIEVKKARELLSLGVIERTMKAGEVLLSGATTDQKLKKLREQFSIKSVDECVVQSVSLNRKEGFLQGVIVLESFRMKGAKVYIEVKNENMKITSPCYGEAFPDLIILFDMEKGVGVHNSTISKGMHVSVLFSPAEEFWRGSFTWSSS